MIFRLTPNDMPSGVHLFVWFDALKMDAEEWHHATKNTRFAPEADQVKAGIDFYYDAFFEFGLEIYTEETRTAVEQLRQRLTDLAGKMLAH